MKILFLFGLVLSLRTSASAPSPPKGFDHHMVVVADVYELYWNVQDDEITFQVQVKTTGYVGFGISPNGGMAGADIIMAWVKDDLVYFQDRHATRNGQPDIDEEQNWTLIKGMEKDGYTIVTFKRPLVSCDKANDIDITGETMRLIYAYHPEDPQEAASVTYHGSKTRGTKSATLLIYGVQKTLSEIPEHTGHFDLLSPETEIPAKPTTYMCYALKLPELDEKQHIVRFEPIIQPGHEGIVHHIVIYSCHHDFDEDSYHGKVGECFNDLMGEVDDCTAFFYAWAIGGSAFNYPDHIGFPIGPGRTPTMVKMEIHYDNPSSKIGMTDSAGMRVYHTSNLRQFDSGYMELGLTVGTGLMIPPHFEELTYQSHCTGECLSKAIPEDEDMKVFSVLLHAHLLGTKIRVRHFRDGKELPLIAKDDYYDFNYQDIRILPEEIIIKRNDHIQVECDYRSTDRENVTYGGLGTQEEMCFVFISFYPYRALSRCTSEPIPAHLLKLINPTFQFDKSKDDSPTFNITGLAYEGLAEAMNSVDWTDKKIRERFQSILKEDDIYIKQVCEDGPTRLLLQDNPIVKVPKFTEFYQEPALVCSQPTSIGFMVKASSLLVLLAIQLLIFA